MGSTKLCWNIIGYIFPALSAARVTCRATAIRTVLIYSSKFEAAKPYCFFLMFTAIIIGIFDATGSGVVTVFAEAVTNRVASVLSNSEPS